MSSSSQDAPSARQDSPFSSAAGQLRSDEFTTGQTAAVMLIAVMMSLVVALQPLLLGPMAGEGRLTLQEIGLTAMLEALGMALAIAACGALLAPQRLKSLIWGAVLVSILANAATVVGEHGVVLLSRFVNGLSVGAVLWIWTGLLARASLPSRLVAIFVTLQSAGALGLSSLFSAFILPNIGASGGYACLAAASAIAGLLALGAPSHFSALPGQNAAKLQIPSMRGFAGLLAVALHQAGILAFWVYVVPLGREQGHSESFVGFAASIALASQIAGGLCAAFLARLDARFALYLSIGASLVGLAIVYAGGNAIWFVVGATIVVFFWMFAPAYQMPYLLSVDPSRRAAMQMITFQLLGLSTGPALASLFVSEHSATPALGVSAALYVIGAALVFVTTALNWPAASRATETA